LIFDDHGHIEQRFALGREDAAVGVDIPPGVWHTAAALSDHAVCFEVKPGPYVQVVDKEFAPWAPREGNPRCAEYLETLLCDFK
jgi:cupin fold WbuC family metalloprotein